MVVTGYWLLVAGYWLVVTGCGLLVGGDRDWNAKDAKWAKDTKGSLTMRAYRL